MPSVYYNAAQLDSLDRLGDVLIPKNGDFPAFSEVGCVHHIDEVMSAAKPQDIKDFGTLLTVMRYLPTLMLVALTKLAINANRLPAFIAPTFRQLDIGIRGVIYTLYYANVYQEGYAGRQVYQAIDYEVRCAPDAPNDFTKFNAV